MLKDGAAKKAKEADEKASKDKDKDKGMGGGKGGGKEKPDAKKADEPAEIEFVLDPNAST